MYTLEELKYLPPKFSYALKDLAQHFGCYEKAEKGDKSLLSTNSSFVSYKQVIIIYIYIYIGCKRIRKRR